MSTIYIILTLLLTIGIGIIVIIDINTKLIMATQAELADGLNKITTQIGKVATEQSNRFDSLTAKIAELEAAITSGGDVSPAVATAFGNVQVALQALDDTIPDAPPVIPPPTP